MQIVNETRQRVHYRLSGGPADMTFSEADLEPGESDTWDPPVFVTRSVACTVHLTVGDETWTARVSGAGQVHFVEVDGRFDVRALG